MDNKEQCKCGPESGACGKKSIRCIVLKVVVIIIIFILGISAGKEFGHGRGERGGRFGGMMYSGQRASYSNGAGPQMMSRFFNNDKEEGEKGEITVFGAITKIEANKITIKDNAAVDEVIVSQASTVILSGNSEIGLSSLQGGQSITAVGSTNKDGQFEAKWISVMQ